MLIRELTVDGAPPSGVKLRAILAARFQSRGGVGRIYRLLNDECLQLAGCERLEPDVFARELALSRERAVRAEAREEAHQRRWAQEIDILRMRVAELEPLAKEARSSQQVILLLRQELRAAQDRLAAKD
jgi:hypothetical protein